MDLHSEVYVEPEASSVRIPRSRLFALGPIGMGTIYSESLTSYLIRLAREHSVGVRELFRREIFPLCGNLGGLRYPIFFNKDARSVNGVGVYARTFSQAATRLTSREDLQFLTLLPWNGLFPEKGARLMAQHPRWCKSCLRDWHTSAGRAYFPLVWSLELHQVCLKHGARLSESCPYCGRHQPVIPFAPFVDRCAYCNGWLASETKDDRAIAAKDHELWMAEAISDMVMHNQYAIKFANSQEFRTLLPALVDQYADGEKKRFSILLGMSDSTMSCWITKGKKPTFPQFLKLCHWLGVVPSQLFKLPGRNFTAKLPAARLRLSLGTIKPKVGLTGEIEPEIETRLDAILLNSEDHRPLIAVARHLGVTARYLRYWFNDYSYCITSKRKHHLSKVARAIRESRKQEVRNTTLRIFCNGIYPSQGKVAAALKPLKIYLQSPVYEPHTRKHLKSFRVKQDYQDAVDFPTKMQGNHKMSLWKGNHKVSFGDILWVQLHRLV